MYENTLKLHVVVAEVRFYYCLRFLGVDSESGTAADSEIYSGNNANCQLKKFLFVLW
jgi:hypothetical protein